MSRKISENVSPVPSLQGLVFVFVERSEPKKDWTGNDSGIIWSINRLKKKAEGAAIAHASKEKTLAQLDSKLLNTMLAGC
jgi:hypothetical protein